MRVLLGYIPLSAFRFLAQFFLHEALDSVDLSLRAGFPTCSVPSELCSSSTCAALGGLAVDVPSAVIFVCDIVDATEHFRLSTLINGPYCVEFFLILALATGIL